MAPFYKVNKNSLNKVYHKNRKIAEKESQNMRFFFTFIVLYSPHQLHMPDQLFLFHVHLLKT